MKLTIALFAISVSLVGCSSVIQESKDKQQALTDCYYQSAITKNSVVVNSIDGPKTNKKVSLANQEDFIAICLAVKEKK